MIPIFTDAWRISIASSSCFRNDISASRSLPKYVSLQGDAVGKEVAT